jgi:cell division transport system permease protein
MLLFHLQTTWHHLRRSPYQTIAAITIAALGMGIINIFALVAFGAEKTIRTLESQPQVIAFFTQPPTEPELEQLKAQLAGTGQTKDIQYISQEQALERYKTDNQDNPLLLEMVTADILPASIEVSAITPESLSQTAEILNLHENIEEVIYQKDVIDELIKWTKFLRIFGISLIITVALTSFLTIFIIIGMKISLRSTEVEILKLLGASSLYIQWPFLIEALIYGILGAILGWGVTYTGLLYSTPYMLDIFWSLQLIPIPYYFMLQLLAVGLIAAGTWCIIASAWAVNRYLKRY